MLNSILFDFLCCLLSTFFPFIFGQFNNQFGQFGAIAIDYSENKWELKMLNKLRFDKSANFYGTKMFKISEMNAFYGEEFDDFPNLAIQYYIDPMDGSPQCNYSIAFNRFDGFISSESAQGNKSLEEGLIEFCENEVKGHPDVHICRNKLENLGSVQVQMQGAGVFNEPMADPRCLYEFYKVATERSEYELLRYCAKGYFYQGYDYNDDRAREMRKDWILYLMSGQLKCNVSSGKNKIGTDQELLGKGYKISMVQKNAKKPTKIEPNVVCRMEAILSEYEDNEKSGKFMIAGIIGSAKLDKPGEKDYFWNADLNLIKENEKGCMKEYMQNTKNETTNEYIFKLKVGHYCTCGKEYEILEFDLSFDPANLAQPGIQEDKNVQVHLDMGILQLSTDSLICADKNLQLCENDTMAKEMKEIRKKLGIKPLAEKEEDGKNNLELAKNAEDGKIQTLSNLEFLDDENVNGTMNLLDDESAIILNGTIIGGNMTNDVGLMMIGNGTIDEDGHGNMTENDGILTILNNNTQN